MTGSPVLLLVATAAVLLLLAPSFALFFGGIPEARSALVLIAAVLLGTALVAGEWTLFGATPGVALLQGSVAAAALVAVLPVGLRRGGPRIVIVFGGLWLLLVAGPVGYAAFDLEHGLLAARLGTLDFGGALVLAVLPGTAAAALAIVLRSSSVPEVAGQPYRPWWLLLLCGLGGGLGLVAVSVGVQLVIDETTGILVRNTLLAAVAGMIGWTITQVINVRRASGAGLVAGVFAGVFAVLPASPWLSPVSVIVLGVIAGLLGHLAAVAARATSAGPWATVIGVCLVPGAVGMIGAGIVAGGPGLLFSGHVDLLQAQALGLGAVVLGSLVVSLLLGLALRLSGRRR